MKEEIIIHEGRKLKVVEVITDGKSQEEMEFEQWSDKKYCLKAVEEDGYTLRYVKEQSEAVCLKQLRITATLCDTLRNSRKLCV